MYARKEKYRTTRERKVRLSKSVDAGRLSTDFEQSRPARSDFLLTSYARE
jgi:hypothetical protein